MQINSIIRIKNPLYAWQHDLRYRVTKLNKTTLRCRLVEYDYALDKWVDVHRGKDYGNIKYSFMEVCDGLFEAALV